MKTTYRPIASALAAFVAVAILLPAFPVQAATAKKAPTKVAATKKVTTKKKATKKKIVLTYVNIPRMSAKDLADPTSRCVTAATKTMHVGTVAQMNKDIEKYGEGHAQAVANYKKEIDMTWAAMEQPYCGFGAFGLQPFIHSYDKSVEHARAEFLKNVQ